MLVTVKGAYKHGKIELAETPEGVAEDSDVLVTFLPSESAGPVKRPQVLYGAWRGKIPPNVDLDAALNEIRSEWQTEWSEENTDA